MITFAVVIVLYTYRCLWQLSTQFPIDDIDSVVSDTPLALLPPDLPGPQIRHLPLSDGDLVAVQALG